LHAKDKKLSHENVEKEEKVDFSVYDSVSSYSEVNDFLASFITDSEAESGLAGEIPMTPRASKLTL